MRVEGWETQRQYKVYISTCTTVCEADNKRETERGRTKGRVSWQDQVHMHDCVTYA